ncbi:MAG: tetratricopeptide repeat protein [Pseudomonadota bacterium]
MTLFSQFAGPAASLTQNMPPVVVALSTLTTIAGLLYGFYWSFSKFADRTKSNIELIDWWKKRHQQPSPPAQAPDLKSSQPSSGPSDYRTVLIDRVADGTISAEDACSLGLALAGERYENPPPPSDELPEGADPASEYVRDFVSLATSNDAREREAAALDAQGKTEEALDLLARLAEEESEVPCARWKARGAMAFNAFTAKAIESYERAIGCDPNDAEAHNQLGNLLRRTGDLARAQAACERVLSLGNQSSDKTLQAIALGNLGVIADVRGDYSAAEDYHQRSLALNQELGRQEGIAAALGNLGLTAQARGDLSAAEGYHQRSLALNEESGLNEGTAATLGNLGVIARMRGDLSVAEDHHLRSLALYEELGLNEGTAAALGNLGVIARMRGDLSVAKDYHQRSLTLNEELGRKDLMANQLANLGALDEEQGDLFGAREKWERALALYREIGMPHMVEKLEGWIADLSS